MSFVFNDEEELFRRQIQEFAQKELAPGARERAKKTEVDMTMVKKMADIGLLAMNVPEKYGGQTVSWVTVGIAIEEMAKVDFTLSVLPIGSCGFLGQALSYAPDYLQDKWFKSLIQGDLLACLCLTEPDCGSDAVAMKTRAVKDGDSYIVNGEKTSVSWGMQAKIGVMFAKTDPAAGARGVSAFLLPTDTPGLTKSAIPDMGWPSAQRASFFFDDVRIPEDHRLGEEGQGFYLAMNVIGVVRVALTLQAIGHAATPRVRWRKPSSMPSSAPPSGDPWLTSRPYPSILPSRPPSSKPPVCSATGLWGCGTKESAILRKPPWPSGMVLALRWKRATRLCSSMGRLDSVRL